MWVSEPAAIVWAAEVCPHDIASRWSVVWLAHGEWGRAPAVVRGAGATVSAAGRSMVIGVCAAVRRLHMPTALHVGGEKVGGCMHGGGTRGYDAANAGGCGTRAAAR